MGKYIVTCDEETASWIGNDVDSMQPITQCQDCIYCHDDDSVWKCTKLDFAIDYITSDVPPNGYCKWSEPRKGGE